MAEVRGWAAALRAGHFQKGNRPKNEPVLNENEKKVLMTIGTETAEGYCTADSLPEKQEDLERAMEGTTIPSVEDNSPRVFLEEMLETLAGLMLVM
uniref:Uncharacterized protein n=1 Tax=Timema shepardi TaxID=629360 RepID=A0A7R9FWL7_TIMSH|nr:unnamed protein product [Timema shepardi]